MKVPAVLARAGEPFADLGALWAEVVQHDVDVQAAGDAAVDLLEEHQDIQGGVSLPELRGGLTGSEVSIAANRSKGAVALVVVGAGLTAAALGRRFNAGYVKCPPGSAGQSSFPVPCVPGLLSWVGTNA